MAPVNTILAPRASGDNCPSTITGGGIAGIVIGSIAGTLLIIWLWRAFRLPGAWSDSDTADTSYRAPPPPVVRSTSSRGRRTRRRPSASYVDYVEKPVSSRRYRDEVSRPQRVYLTDP
ncbi:hypothetical protein N7535_007645 [Penicillium sp. DV-2018c]|nr:hypothetical protein N7461_003675 [Penicillium sp. DV-2018c]KAJ5566007.1 hypothetical protein N7535_007645 [Penicillium sp. DV-2018c]